ncbi:hypothetical protein QJQ45_016612 [Haematococcus lacustris]|nr:hypothetical protein QJQ45_016612 [Haematococcus lacustris]
MGDEHHPVGRSQAKRGRDGEELADENRMKHKQDGDRQTRGHDSRHGSRHEHQLRDSDRRPSKDTTARGTGSSHERNGDTGAAGGEGDRGRSLRGGDRGGHEREEGRATGRERDNGGHRVTEERGVGGRSRQASPPPRHRVPRDEEPDQREGGSRQGRAVGDEGLHARPGAGPEHRMATMPACQREQQQGGRGRDSSGGREDKGGRAAQGDRTTREEGRGGAGREERGGRGGKEDRNEKGAVEERGDKAARDGRGDRGGRPHQSDLRGDTYPRDTERGRPAREHPDSHRTPVAKFESDSWGARPAARPRTAPGSVWEVVTWRDGSSRPVHERDSAPSARPHGREGRPGGPQENGRRGGAGAGEERGQPGTDTAPRRLGGQGAREEGWPNGDLPRRYGSSRSQFQSVTPASARPRYTSWGRPQDEVDRWEGGQGSEGTGLGEAAGGGFGGERHPAPGLVGGGPPHGRGHARHGVGPDQIPYPRMGPGRSLSTGRGAEWMEQGPQGLRGRMLPEQQMFQQAPYRPPARPRSPEPSKWAHDKFEALEADEEGAAAVV